MNFQALREEKRRRKRVIEVSKSSDLEFLKIVFRRNEEKINKLNVPKLGKPQKRSF